jgi:phosphoglycerate kinase
MTFTFVKALGGKGILFVKMTNRIGFEILRLAEKVQIHIPVDVVAANAFSNDAETKIVDVDEILTDGKV